jgi:ArsR family metal-binding transcriptional regulator
VLGALSPSEEVKITMQNIKRFIRSFQGSPPRRGNSSFDGINVPDGGYLIRNIAANPRRRELAAALAAMAMSRDDLARLDGMSMLDYHLELMEAAGVVEKRDGIVMLTGAGKNLIADNAQSFVPDQKGLSGLKPVSVVEYSSLLPCPKDPSRFRITAKIDPPFDGSLQLLRPLFTRAQYSKVMNALIVQWQSANVTIYSSGNVTITMLTAEKEAKDVLEDLLGVVNNAIVASSKQKRYVDPREVNRHLAHTNCGECGEMSCFCFALKLVTGETTLDKCKPLSDAKFSDKRQRLEALVGS